MSRGAYVAAAVLLCAIAAAGIVALVIVDSEYFLKLNLIYTGIGLLLFGAIAAAGATTTGTFAWVGWLAALAAVAAFAFLMLDSWQADEFGERSETVAKLGGSLTLFSLALAWTALLLSRVKTQGVRALVLIAVLAMLVVATFLTVAYVGSTGDVTYFRIVAVIAVLGVLSAALIPVARGLRRPA